MVLKVPNPSIQADKTQTFSRAILSVWSVPAPWLAYVCNKRLSFSL
jgi:hypothetical protein